MTRSSSAPRTPRGTTATRCTRCTTPPTRRAPAARTPQPPAHHRARPPSSHTASRAPSTPAPFREQGWRDALRHRGGADSPELASDEAHASAYAKGKQRLLVAALDWIEQRRPEEQPERREASKLEVNIAAHIFRAFIYLYQSEPDPQDEDKSTLVLERIYGPDWATFAEHEKLLRISIAAFPDEDGDRTFYSYSYGASDAYGPKDGRVTLFSPDGDRAPDEDVEARVSIVGGLTPLAVALRKQRGTPALEHDPEIADLMERGRICLRGPRDAVGPRDDAWAREAEREIRKLARTRRGTEREEALVQRNEQGVTRGGYPRRQREVQRWTAPDDHKKPWTPEDLANNPKLEKYRGSFRRSLAAYGKKMDRNKVAKLQKQLQAPDLAPAVRRGCEQFTRTPHFSPLTRVVRVWACSADFCVLL